MSARLTDPHHQTAFLLARHGVDLVLDVGANIGQYARSLRAAGYQGRIISFEPQRAAHTQLAEGAAGDAHWTVAPRCAIGSENGEITINISASSDMSSARLFTEETQRHFASDRFVANETVQSYTLDRLWADYVPTGARVFLKSDTQGFEMEVLSGASDHLIEICGVQVEASLHPIYQGQPDFRMILDWLTRRGFAPMQVIPGYFSRHHGRMLEIDLVLFRPSADAENAAPD